MHTPTLPGNKPIISFIPKTIIFQIDNHLPQVQAFKEGKEELGWNQRSIRGGG